MTTLEPILDDFTPVTLDEVTEVKLMNRIDRKFWFASSKLEFLLEQLKPMYNVLEVNGKRLMGYQTIYFDTTGNQMYLHHHNGFRDRFKVRRRKYETSELGFFEIKRKTNKQRTIKSRIEIPFHNGALTETECRFLDEQSPYKNLKLYPVLYNGFKRISLINKRKNERCTIDIQLVIKNNSDKISLENLAIIELKRENHLYSSPLTDLLKELHINKKGLSKYCTGRALLEPTIKSNRFKPALLHLEKKILNNQLLCFT